MRSLSFLFWYLESNKLIPLTTSWPVIVVLIARYLFSNNSSELNVPNSKRSGWHCAFDGVLIVLRKRKKPKPYSLLHSYGRPNVRIFAFAVWKCWSEIVFLVPFTDTLGLEVMSKIFDPFTLAKYSCETLLIYLRHSGQLFFRIFLTYAHFTYHNLLTIGFVF